MENIWSAHTLCLGWLHKCMRLCNPDLRSYFSLLWSISYFVFNHIGQPAGWFPGGLSQMASLTAWPSAQVSLPPPRCFPRVFPASLPMKPSSGSLCQHTSCESWWGSWSARSLFRQCVELACSLGSSSLTVWTFQQAGQSWQPPAPSSRQGCLFPNTGRRWCTWRKEYSEPQQKEFKTGFLMALFLLSSLMTNGSNMHFTRLSLQLLS